MIYKINSFLFLYFLKIFHSLAVQSKPCICTVLPLRYGKTLSWWERTQHSGFKIVSPSFLVRLKQPYLNFSSFVVDLHLVGGKKRQACSKLTGFGWVGFFPPPTSARAPPVTDAQAPPPAAAAARSPGAGPRPQLGCSKGRAAWGASLGAELGFAVCCICLRFFKSVSVTETP